MPLLGWRNPRTGRAASFGQCGAALTKRRSSMGQNSTVFLHRRRSISQNSGVFSKRPASFAQNKLCFVIDERRWGKTGRDTVIDDGRLAKAALFSLIDEAQRHLRGGMTSCSASFSASDILKRREKARWASGSKPRVPANPGTPPSLDLLARFRMSEAYFSSIRNNACSVRKNSALPAGTGEAMIGLESWFSASTS